MTGIPSNINFTAEQPKVNQSKPQKEVVYVSKNPNAIVNATGVVAGTAGMVGGAVLGGTVGLCKLPAGMASSLVGANYGDIFKSSLNGLKDVVKNSPELSGLIDAFSNMKTPEASEELVTILKTLSERLNVAFEHDKAAKAVIDKTIDPILSSLTVKRNVRNIGSGLRAKIKSPVGQTILKFLGFNKKTSSIVGSVVGNVAKGFATSVENIQNFTPEEKAAWSKVAEQIKTELMTNPKLKTTGAVGKALGAMFKDFNWLTTPLKNTQNTIIDAVKDIAKKVEYAPVKTIGKWSAIGAVACGTLSTLGWLGLKKSLMSKENEKAVKAGQV